MRNPRNTRGKTCGRCEIHLRALPQPNIYARRFGSYIYARRQKIICGHLWSFVVICGHLWSFVVICGHLCSFVLNFASAVRLLLGSVVSLAPSSDVNEFVATCGHLRSLFYAIRQLDLQQGRSV